jgi:hypothetical protein
MSILENYHFFVVLHPKILYQRIVETNRVREIRTDYYYNPYSSSIDYPLEEKLSKVKRLSIIPIRNAQDIYHALTDRQIEESNKSWRIKSLGEFETVCLSSSYGDKPSDKALNIFSSLLRDFHPSTKPVLWRILITQSLLYQALIDFHNIEREASNKPLLGTMSRTERERFYWRQESKESEEEKVLEEPFTAAQKYLREHPVTKGFFEDPTKYEQGN